MRIMENFANKCEQLFEESKTITEIILHGRVKSRTKMDERERKRFE